MTNTNPKPQAATGRHAHRGTPTWACRQQRNGKTPDDKTQATNPPTDRQRGRSIFVSLACPVVPPRGFCHRKACFPRFRAKTNNECPEKTRPRGAVLAKRDACWPTNSQEHGTPDVRTNHYERAFESYLRERRVAYVAVNEARRSLVGGGTLKNLDFIVSPQRLGRPAAGHQGPPIPLRHTQQTVLEELVAVGRPPEPGLLAGEARPGELRPAGVRLPRGRPPRTRPAGAPAPVRGPPLRLPRREGGRLRAARKAPVAAMADRAAPHARLPRSGLPLRRAAGRRRPAARHGEWRPRPGPITLKPATPNPNPAKR